MFTKTPALLALFVVAISLTAVAQTNSGSADSVTGPTPSGPGTAGNPAANPLDTASSRQPYELGVIFSGGNGVTDQRGGYHFAQLGVHFGRVLTNNFGGGPLRGNFEYAVELFPYWQAFTPVSARVACVNAPNTPTGVACSLPYNVGGTYTGIELRPIILRLNLARHGRVTPWVQGAGGVLWTNHKFPAYGTTQQSLAVNGPNSETSVWNFTPQGGIGLHYFTSASRSIDLSANAEHISSASLGDRNPGVNASVQFTVGYTWWK